MGIGLLAAGLSSTLTAPIAAAYAAKGLFGWKGNENSKNFRFVWILILVIGITVSMLGIKPIPIIKFAQITNALLLPFIAIFLMYISNSTELLGKYKNSILSNIFGGFVILVAVVLSAKSLNGVFGV